MKADEIIRLVLAIVIYVIGAEIVLLTDREGAGTVICGIGCSIGLFGGEE